MPDEEARDLEILKARMQEIKLNCYAYLESVDRMDATDLLHSGYRNKTNAEAMQAAFKSYQKDVKKLVDAHVKRYPDV